MLLPGIWLKTEITGLWARYIALVDVAEENRRLREERNTKERYLASVRGDLAELARLRTLVGLKPPEQWRALGVRVLAGRFGPGASLETVMIDRGFATGAAPGTPLVTHQGLVGRVYRASPHVATVLLLSDTAFRAAVVTSEGRIPGVLVGGGPRANLEVRYMAPNARISAGEILITSGLDATFPKGLPVAKIVSVEPGAENLFQQVRAEPLASPESMEEALLLIAPENWPVSAGLPDMTPDTLPGALPGTLPDAGAAPPGARP